MSLNRCDQILQVFFPDARHSEHSVWAILDGARDDSIFPFLRNCGLDYICLYSGYLPRELQLVAPYLVELPPKSSITRNIINMAWGNSWGIFLSIKDASNLRHHLRKFLRVEEEDGKKLIFRYYDPRVFRAFLPTCSHEQLKIIFGKIDCYWAENESSEEIIEYIFKDNKLHKQVIGLLKDPVNFE